MVRRLWRGSHVLQLYRAVEAGDPEGKEERAMTEAVLLRKLSSTPGCRHVVRCHGVVEELHGRYCDVKLVLELALCGSLGMILHSDEAGVVKTPRFWRAEDGSWAEERREHIEAREMGWLIGTAEGLRLPHSYRLTHCDVKASTGLLFDDGRVPKLADLGSCELERNRSLQFTVSCATEHIAMISRRYAPPERTSRSGPIALDNRPPVDVWSFGVLAFEILFAEKAWKEIKNDTDPAGLEKAKADMKVAHMLEHIPAK